MRKKPSMCRILACSFKRSCSIVKSRNEQTAEIENAEENREKEIQPEQTVEETESPQENASEPDIQVEQGSQASSFTEEERGLSEEKVESEASETPLTPSDYKELKYKPATIPERNKFQAGVTFVDSQGYVYAQEVKEGKKVPIALKFMSKNNNAKIFTPMKLKVEAKRATRAKPGKHSSLMPSG